MSSVVLNVFATVDAANLVAVDDVAVGTVKLGAASTTAVFKVALSASAVRTVASTRYYC